MLSVDVLARRDELAGIAPRWDELAQLDGRDGFFRTSRWYRAWMDHIRPDAEPFVVVARDGAGRILGLAPWCRLSYRDLGFRLNGIAWAGREVVSGDFLDFVCDPAARAEAVSSILNFVWETCPRWGALVMGELIDGGDSRRALEELARQRGLSMRCQEERICPYIALPPSFDEYLAGLSSSTRYHIRRRMRDFEKKGAHVEVYTEPEQVASRLDTLIRLHLARWRKDSLPGTMGRPGFAAFLKEVCGKPPAGSQCRLYLLQQEEKSLAALLTFHFRGSALYYQAGWDPESPLASQSPGVVVMSRSIQDAIAEGLQYYEFLRGDETYKSRWTKTYRTTSTLILARSAMASNYLRVARLKDLVKQHLPRRGAQAGAGEQAGGDVGKGENAAGEDGARPAPRSLARDDEHATV